VLDQVRTVDKRRLMSKMGHLNPALVHEVKAVIKEMLVD